jgi:hypothetical protein
MSHEEHGKIALVRVGTEDHGIPTATVHITGDGWGQSMGGLCLKDAAEGYAFVRSLATVFGCSPDALEGQPCVVLRSFEIGPIDGLRSPVTGRTFSVQAWLEKHRPGNEHDPLARRLRDAREQHARLLHEAAMIMAQLTSGAIEARYRKVVGEAP